MNDAPACRTAVGQTPPSDDSLSTTVSSPAGHQVLFFGRPRVDEENAADSAVATRGIGHRRPPAGNVRSLPGRNEDTDRAIAMAVQADRTRLARELHDVVGHEVTLMLLQAAGAARILHTDPQRAEAALARVAELGRQAIDELRRMLGLLLSGEDRTAKHQLSDPDNLQDLIERTRTDTFQASLSCTGTPAPVSPEVDLSAYRVVQEALTNAIRFADQRHPVRVTVAWHPAALKIQVCNRVSYDSPLPHRLSTGWGLTAMRERVAAAGGRCRAGLQVDGHFHVTATFPLAGPALRRQKVT
ncbi:sensor histidine kinase [Streptomyces sp. NPDC059786]|uniref:sensor histidine kinase n=1 Tax=Streptomyces sp. NPDC059786 TaxID=3346946 RepID=UPI00364C7FE3